jgi:Arc/MetJ-type ribon-helix-helix transcriptional regulator
MSNKQSYPIHIRVSKELLTLIDQVRIADKHDSRASVGRAALRNYLEKQEDQIGNRHHFNKTMSDRMDRLEQMLVQIQVNQTAAMIMGAQIDSEILTAITGKKDLNAALAVKEAFDVAQVQHENIQNRSLDIVAMLIQKAQQQSETLDTSE